MWRTAPRAKPVAFAPPTQPAGGGGPRVAHLLWPGAVTPACPIIVLFRRRGACTPRSFPPPSGDARRVRPGVSVSGARHRRRRRALRPSMCAFWLRPSMCAFAGRTPRVRACALQVVTRAAAPRLARLRRLLGLGRVRWRARRSCSHGRRFRRSPHAAALPAAVERRGRSPAPFRVCGPGRFRNPRQNARTFRYVLCDHV